MVPKEMVPKEMVPKEMSPEDSTEFESSRADQPNNQSSKGMGKENNEITTAASAGGGRYPILSQILAFPGLFAGTLGAIVLTVVGAVLPRMVPAISTTSALVVAAPAMGLSLGLGIGWDGPVPHRLAQRFQPIGFALLILPPVMGPLVGPDTYTLTWISVAGLAVALGSIAIGQRVSGVGAGRPQS
ncbi:hypothetical protein [Salinibacter ruber]|uniref:hypothetical protein n=1 Tax=Salinibacter ruber TaxID=146919 RepID=UPI002073CDA7|nr:hypothetical protein [Salinibacter ruber]